MKHFIKWSAITVMVLSVVLLIGIWLSPVMVGAISGVDNQSAYTEALQNLLYSLQETLQRLVDNSGKIVDAMSKTQDNVIKVFEKAIQ